MTKYGKTIWTGLESSGKSLAMAIESVKVLERNGFFIKKGLKPRVIASTMLFSNKFEERAKKLKVPIFYFKDLEQVAGMTGCDIFFDEIGRFFDSQLWTEIPQDVRGWLAQCEKNGVNIYGTSQDFSQVALSFRRLTKNLYYISKIAGSRRPHITYPLVKFVWGLCMVRSLDPKGYKEQEIKVDKTGFPSFFLIDFANTSIYDTNQNVSISSVLPFRHIVKVCKECGFSKVLHS